ncbi:hypothetical protein IHE45_04G024300 [Dioscorea alata]|uniref:Uncharacterized protein n=1 Tax=Dioscorea alata TaxID=55571 RepID=A0ACB7WBQ2_DIOAL|nr:hypothetical protein IHE45_04G024300 [Dioscorea alata]
MEKELLNLTMREGGTQETKKYLPGVHRKHSLMALELHGHPWSSTKVRDMKVELEAKNKQKLIYVSEKLRLPLKP